MTGQAKVTLLLELKNRLKGGITSANRFLNDNIKSMKDRLRNFKESHIQAFQAMRNEIPMFDRAMNIMGNPYTKIIAGVTALTLVYGKASAMAGQWEKGMAKANVTAQLSKADLGKLSDQILEIGARNATDLMEVPEAFNRIISAGLDTNAALKALEPTLQAAKAGFTDVETVAKAAVSVMNSSGISDITKVYDVLFATLNKGNAEFSDIAQYLPKILPMARQAGAGLDEVAGAYAYLTAQGMSAEQSATGLQNVYKALSDQQIIFGTETKKGLKGLGIDVFDAAGKMKPLISIVTQLQDKMKSLTNEQKVSFLDQIGFDMEAGTTLASMTQDAGKLKEILDFTANSGGQLAAAMDNAKVSGEEWVIMGNQLKKTMIEIGRPVNETFGNLAKKLLPVVIDLLKVVKQLFQGIWEVISPIVDVLGDIIVGVHSIISGVVTWLDKLGLLKPVIDGVLFAINPLLGAINLIIKGMQWISKNKPDFMKSKEEKQIEYKNKADKAYTEMQSKMKDAAGNYNADTYKQWGWVQDGSGNWVMPERKEDLMPDGGTGNGAFSPAKVKATKAPGETSISGKAQAVRNITINIGNLSNVEKMNVAGDGGKPMNKKDFEAYMKETLTRLLRGVETSYE